MITRLRIFLIVAVAATLAAPTAAPAAVVMSVAPTTVTTEMGREFTVRSTIRNDGSTQAAVGLIAHITVFSLEEGTYVDPEDWSSDRTRYLEPVPGGGATTILWKLKAVSGGTFAASISVVAAGTAARLPVTAPPVRIEVAERRTLNAGGILILSVGLPAALALVAGGLRFRRRRPRPLLEIP